MKGKIDIPKTKYSKYLEGITFAILVGNIIYLILSWSSIPSKIPAHFDFAGNPDRYGSKGELLIVPIMAIILYLGISLCQRYPNIWNTGVEITENNKNRIYKYLNHLILTVKCVVIITFCYMSIMEVKGYALGGWFLPVSLFFTFGPIIYYMVRIFKTPESEK